MNRLIFIPGKNPDLSLAELASWYDSSGFYFRLAEMGDGFMAAEAEKAPDANRLGGMIKVCSLLESFDKKPLQHPESIFEKIPVKFLPKGRLFGLSVYPDSGKNSSLFNHFASSLKKNLKDCGINCKFFPVPKDRSALTHVEVINKKLEEIVVCLGKKIHIAKTISVHNPFEFQKRDVKRPQQRPMYSIPPRLARIMINLAQTPNSKTLLDPFCGIGSILQEAALMDFEIFGSDLDGRCAYKAIQNLKWLSKQYCLKIPDIEEKIIMADATRLSAQFQPKSMDMIVTEPHLGPPLKIHPDRNRAQRILRGLKPLYEKSLREFSLILRPGGRVCIVFPRFEFGGHFAHLEAVKMAEKAGLRPVDVFRKTGLPGGLPYIDKEERHKTIREIWVFEKPGGSKLMPKPPVDLALEKG